MAKFYWNVHFRDEGSYAQDHTPFTRVKNAEKAAKKFIKKTGHLLRNSNIVISPEPDYFSSRATPRPELS